jgi:hypothetical protein
LRGGGARLSATAAARPPSHEYAVAVADATRAVHDMAAEPNLEALQAYMRAGIAAYNALQDSKADLSDPGLECVAAVLRSGAAPPADAPQRSEPAPSPAPSETPGEGRPSLSLTPAPSAPSETSGEGRPSPSLTSASSSKFIETLLDWNVDGVTAVTSAQLERELERTAMAKERYRTEREAFDRAKQTYVPMGLGHGLGYVHKTPIVRLPSNLTVLDVPLPPVPHVRGGALTHAVTPLGLEEAKSNSSILFDAFRDTNKLGLGHGSSRVL